MASKVRQLVEKVGMMMVFWQEYQRRTWTLGEPEWTDAEYSERKCILLDNMSQMFAELGKRQQTVQTYGWTYTSTGDWHRVGEPAPERLRLLILDDPEEDTEFVEVAEEPPLFADESEKQMALSPWA